MAPLVARAPAKVNLTLRVAGRSLPGAFKFVRTVRHGLAARGDHDRLEVTSVGSADRKRIERRSRNDVVR